MTKQISPLRQRMLDDMAFRNMSAGTQQCYTNAVDNALSAHHPTCVPGQAHRRAAPPRRCALIRGLARRCGALHCQSMTHEDPG